MHDSLLSGRRTAVVTSKEKDGLTPLFDRADATSAVAAKLEAGVYGQRPPLHRPPWCRISGSGFDGWIEQQRLWGVYLDEKID